MSCGSVGSAVRGFRLVNRQSAYGLRPTARELRPKQPGVGRTQDKRPQDSQQAPSCMTSIRRWPGIATCLTIIRPFPAKLAPEGGTERLRNFFGPKPVLMLVEPGSLCWVGGRMVEARDGPTWAVEFARFSALSGVVRDDGSGLGKGLKLERARRRAEGQPDLEDSLDIFHTFREGGRALRKTWGAASRA